MECWKTSNIPTFLSGPDFGSDGSISTFSIRYSVFDILSEGEIAASYLSLATAALCKCCRSIIPLFQHSSSIFPQNLSRMAGCRR